MSDHMNPSDPTNPLFSSEPADPFTSAPVTGAFASASPAYSGSVQRPISRKPRSSTAVWGLLVMLVGLNFLAIGLQYTLDLTWVVSGGLGLMGLLFVALSLRQLDKSRD